MSDVFLESREVERLLDMRPSTLRAYADGLGIGGRQKGVARRWSLGELTGLLVAQRLADGGLTVAASVAIARSLDEQQFVRLVSDDAARLFAVCFFRGEASFEISLCETAHDALAAVATGQDAVVLDLRRHLEDAFVMVLEARRGGRREP